MENVEAFDWYRMFIGEQPILYFAEIIFRTLVIYLYAVFLLRFMGKRGSRNLSTFENVVVIALGSATGDSLFYPQVPILYAVLVITLIVGLSRLMQILQIRSKPINTFIDGYPIMMVKDGQIMESGLEKARLRKEELMGMLRMEGLHNTNQISYAFLERSGMLSVLKPEDDSSFAGLTLIPKNLANNQAGEI